MNLPVTRGVIADILEPEEVWKNISHQFKVSKRSAIALLDFFNILDRHTTIV